MAKPPVLNSGHLHYQTWSLRVYIHCEGCKKKVFKVLQSIDGVYKTEIDSKQHKVIVTGSVNGDTLVQKLLKSGKHAEILPESFEATAAPDTASGKSKKKKQSNKQKDCVTTDDNEHVDNKEEESEFATADGGDDGNFQEIAPPAVAGSNNDTGGGGGGKKKKNKKKKSEKKDADTPPNDDTDALPAENTPADSGVTTENVEGSMEKLNLGPPRHPMVNATPYQLPPYQSHYPIPIPIPIPAYGMSYSTSYPSTESSYYTPPVYGYAQSHPSLFYPPQAPPSYYPRSAFDDYDDPTQDGRGCSVM